MVESVCCRRNRGRGSLCNVSKGELVSLIIREVYVNIFYLLRLLDCVTRHV